MIRIVSAFVLGLAVLTAGCQLPAASSQPQPARAPSIFKRPETRAEREQKKENYIDVSATPTSDDIVFVNNYWQAQPWIVDSVDRITGLSARSYFVSSATERGVFVSGDILVWINLIQTDGFGRFSRARLSEQRIPPSEALGMRVRKKSLLGYSYGTIIRFPEGAALGGQEIEVQIGYESLDGRIVKATPRRFKVPLTGASLESAEPAGDKAPPAAGPERRSRPGSAEAEQP